MQLSEFRIAQLTDDAAQNQGECFDLPLTELKGEEIPAPLQTKANRPPFVLIPGVLDHKREMIKLAEELHGPHESSAPPIYVYDDEARVSQLSRASQASVNTQTLEDHGKWIADEIQKRHPVGPYVIVGFSYGCMEAFETAKALAKQGLDSYLYLLDGPTSTVARKYFSVNDANVTKELIAILNATANLYCMDNRVFSENEIEAFRAIPLANRVHAIAQAIKEHQEDVLPHLSLFTCHVLAITQNILKLNNHTFAPMNAQEEEGKITIHALTTHRSAQKYNAEQGGWDKLGYPFYPIETHCLKSIDHLAIVSAPDALELIGGDLQLIENECKKKLLIPSYHPTKLMTTKLRDIKREATKYPELTNMFSAMLAQAAVNITASSAQSEPSSPEAAPDSSRASNTPNMSISEAAMSAKSSFSDEETRLEARMLTTVTTSKSPLISPGFTSPVGCTTPQENVFTLDESTGRPFNSPAFFKRPTKTKRSEVRVTRDDNLDKRYTAYLA